MLNEAGQVAASGMIHISGDDAASGDHVHQIDLSTVRVPGRYRLDVGGVVSHPFVVGAGVFHPLTHAALNYFYQTRADIAIEARYAGGVQWARTAGHPRERVSCFKGGDQCGTAWPGGA